MSWGSDNDAYEAGYRLGLEKGRAEAAEAKPEASPCDCGGTGIRAETTAWAAERTVRIVDVYGDAVNVRFSVCSCVRGSR